MPPKTEQNKNNIKPQAVLFHISYFGAILERIILLVNIPHCLKSCGEYELRYKMSLSNEILPLLKEHDLMAFIVNEGWILIRRKNYIDLFIDDQPYSSVEVLLHPASTVR